MTTTRLRTAQAVARRSFPGVPDSAARVREWSEWTCAQWQVAVPETLTLVASELASNAVCHTRSGQPGGQFATRLLLLPDRIRLEVRDAGPLSGRTPLRRTPALTAEHGRGLVLVDALATSWGRLPVGTGAFAELPRVPGRDA
ncbi:ATP-binding protein [Nocardiopsis halotolerans]|uniref:ATP-binding protein n=1 Tax=Nocardiopsis halotolerans TaxID=124252 RepID=UPI000345ED8C|nr:ATP-binding protein [Nocardiopsis halotolerans]